MKLKALQILVLGSLLLASTSVMAAPAFEIVTPAKDIEKAHTFKLLVKITTDEKLTDLVVAPIYPEGFCMEAMLVPGVAASEHAKPERFTNATGSKDAAAERPECTGINDIATVALIEKDSFIIPFTVYPPDTKGNPETGDKRSYYSTREQKKFAFNFSYSLEHDGKPVKGNASQQIELRYTTSIGFYLLSGLFGVFLGYMVKTATKEKEEISGVVAAVAGLAPKTRTFLYHILIARLPMLLTLMVMGFAVLLSMAQESLPVSSWHQAIALGIGLGILGDEKLISKIK
ncbi:MAG: hypothetical protein Q9M30_06750 [Mariprofundaceae bacterium]|nr:hypothetical protein [Mariprofundaceae bacterium]